MKQWVALTACALFAFGCPTKNPDTDGGDDNDVVTESSGENQDNVISEQSGDEVEPEADGGSEMVEEAQESAEQLLDTETVAETVAEVQSEADGGSEDAGEYVPPSGYCDFNQCFPIPPSNQNQCYTVEGHMTCEAFPCNADGSPDFCGQDAQYPNNNRTYSCYNAAGVETACSSLPNARADEVVIDSLTGLMWQRTWTTTTWLGALDYCAALDYGELVTRW